MNSSAAVTEHPAPTTNGRGSDADERVRNRRAKAKSKVCRDLAFGVGWDTEKLLGDMEIDLRLWSTGTISSGELYRTLLAKCYPKAAIAERNVRLLRNALIDLLNGVEVESDTERHLRQYRDCLVDQVEIDLDIDPDYGADADGRRGTRTVVDWHLNTHFAAVEGIESDDLVPVSVLGTWASGSVEITLTFRLSWIDAKAGRAFYDVEAA